MLKEVIMSQLADKKGRLESNPAEFVTQEIKGFITTSPVSKLDFMNNYMMYDEPIVRFADGDDAIFTEYKQIIGPVHLTPREALATAYGKTAETLPDRLSVISWILPITGETRKSNRKETKGPSRLWCHTRWYGEMANEALGAFIVELLTGAGYLVATPLWQPSFETFTNEKGLYSNWSERHVAFAAGQGTFSLSDGLITERGIAHRCGSLVTNLVLLPSPRTASSPYSNCLAYVGTECVACIKRCPAGALSEQGHDKPKCLQYMRSIGYNSAVLKEQGYDNDTSIAGCGLCQTKVPCEDKNPTNKLKKS